jgi:hypothetical protein
MLKVVNKVTCFNDKIWETFFSKKIKFEKHSNGFNIIIKHCLFVLFDGNPKTDYYEHSILSQESEEL